MTWRIYHINLLSSAMNLMRPEPHPDGIKNLSPLVHSSVLEMNTCFGSSVALSAPFFVIFWKYQTLDRFCSFCIIW